MNILIRTKKQIQTSIYRYLKKNIVIFIVRKWLGLVFCFGGYVDGGGCVCE